MRQEGCIRCLNPPQVMCDAVDTGHNVFKVVALGKPSVANAASDRRVNHQPICVPLRAQMFMRIFLGPISGFTWHLHARALQTRQCFFSLLNGFPLLAPDNGIINRTFGENFEA
ncbi:MAG: hypothetical protein NXH94_20805 [Rhodobacteraceae bacterium]|nr:hypothetical protein [Paracoccaceae bacterium]